MFKKKTGIILFILFIMNSTHASCYSVFKSLFNKGLKDSESIDFTQKVTRIENFTNFLRKGKKDPTPALNLKIATKINKLHENIFANNFSANEREWRSFFRTMEANLIGVTRFKKISQYLKDNPNIETEDFLKALDEMNFNDEFKVFIKEQFNEQTDLKKFKAKLDSEINSTLVKIGNNYQEYRMVRGSLDDLLASKECNEVCKKQINMLLSELGANSQKESLAHPTFFKGQKRPSIESLRKFLYAQPLFVLTKSKKERNVELLSFLLSYLKQPIFIDRIVGLIYKSDTLGHKKAVQLFKLFYDTHAKNVYFPKLNKIIFSSNGTKENLQTLKGLNSTIDKDELLVTLSRRIDTLAQKKWKELKEYAKKFEQDFYKKMEAAEKKGEARGQISPTRDHTLLTKIVLFGAAGAGTYSYFYFDGEPTSIEVELEENEIPLQNPPSENGDGVEVAPTDRGVVPYDNEQEENATETEYPILLEGPVDQMLDEASEVIEESNINRGPSSMTKKEEEHSFFSKLWCSLFTCDSHK